MRVKKFLCFGVSVFFSSVAYLFVTACFITDVDSCGVKLAVQRPFHKSFAAATGSAQASPPLSLASAIAATALQSLPSALSEKVAIVCSGKPVPRFLRLVNEPVGDFLQANEVEAVTAQAVNVARGAACTASSVYKATDGSAGDYSCSALVDGVREAVGSGFFHSGERARGEYVEIDLGAEVALASVVVYNRVDAAWERMAGQQLQLLDGSRRMLVSFSLKGIKANQSFDTSNLACPSQAPTRTATRSAARTRTAMPTASLSTGASPPMPPKHAALLTRRYAEFRRCLSIAESPCASDTATELPPDPPPYEELEAHFYELLAATESMRGMAPHVYAGYGGPWIENEFVAYAARANFSVFHLFYPLVPLFVQTVDACLLGCCTGMGYKELDPTANDALLALFRGGLRRDVIYVIILQADAGLCFLPREEDCVARNVLALSPGGWGNVALPLIKGRLAPDDFGGAPAPDAGTPDAYSRAALVTSVVSDTNPMRAVARTRMSAALNGTAQFRHFFGGAEWKGVVHDSVLSMSPRGYGRTSFRMSELVQMGVPQVYVYDDVAWAPYWDPAHPDGRAGRTDVWGPDGLGYLAHLSNLAAVADGLCAAMAPPEAAANAAHDAAACPGGRPAGPPFVVHRGSRIDRMRARAAQLAASHFTYDGVIQRIFEFIKTPWDADLLCVPRPRQRT
jgi:hypothetical protein